MPTKPTTAKAQLSVLVQPNGNQSHTNYLSQSIIPHEIRGVQKITGYRGKGKSWYVSTVEDPDLTVFYDFEKKGEGIDSQVEFGLYVPVTELASGGGVGVYDIFIKKIQELPKDRYTHVIIDNSAPLETAMRAEAVRNAHKYAKDFGMIASNIIENKYGGQGGVVNYLVSEQICNPLWSKGIKLISVTSHIKPRWAAGSQIVNSYNIKGSDRWDELSVLTLILFAAENSPAPSAIVHKEQLGQLQYIREKKTWERKRRLPYRLPLALPEEVARYLREPADLKNPKQGEMPTETEIAPFREEITKEQSAMIIMEFEREKARLKETNGSNNEEELFGKTGGYRYKARQLKKEGMGNVQIARVMSEEFKTNITTVQVIQWTK